MIIIGQSNMQILSRYEQSHLTWISIYFLLFSCFAPFFFFFTQNVRRSPNSDSLNCEARRFGTEVSPTHHQQQQQSRYNQAIKPAKTRLQRQREEVQ